LLQDHWSVRKLARLATVKEHALGASGNYAIVLLLIAVAGAAALGILLLTHLVGPRRGGPIKDGAYESGMVPVGEARRRFHVRFYIVAMLFLLFDVEIVFFYPWASLFPRLKDANVEGATHADWAGQMVAAGFGRAFSLLEMLIFIAVLLVGYVYAWRKGVFRWD
jgi:NADH-quinone oxidoreductase subunit A